jgi:hypothetical protein
LHDGGIWPNGKPSDPNREGIGFVKIVEAVMRYRVYSCCTEQGSKDFDKPARLEGTRDTLDEVEELIQTLTQRGKDAWYETEEDED